MKSTQKELVAYQLYQYIAQRSDYLARTTGIPAPSVRRILQELVQAGRATFTESDLFGFSGYVTVRQRRAR